MTPMHPDDMRVLIALFLRLLVVGVYLAGVIWLWLLVTRWVG